MPEHVDDESPCPVRLVTYASVASGLKAIDPGDPPVVMDVMDASARFVLIARTEPCMMGHDT